MVTKHGKESEVASSVISSLFMCGVLSYHPKLTNQEMKVEAEVMEIQRSKSRFFF